MPRKGQSMSEEAKRKISLSIIGKQLSDDTKRKIGLANKGRIPWHKGKTGVYSHEMLQNMSRSRKGKNTGTSNALWKDDSVGKRSLHYWVRRHLPQPELCQICGIKPSEDLANMTDIYNRAYTNWKYLCKQCHGSFDSERRLARVLLKYD